MSALPETWVELSCIDCVHHLSQIDFTMLVLYMAEITKFWVLASPGGINDHFRQILFLLRVKIGAFRTV